MKRIALIIVIMGLLASLTAKAQQTAVDPNRPVITFERDTIDYGTIAHNSDGYRYFNFTNTGKEPLLISEVHCSCDCLIASWPRYPIQPGASAEIKAHYYTGRVGRFTKTLTVASNATQGSKIIWTRGNVLPDTPASIIGSQMPTPAK